MAIYQLPTGTYQTRAALAVQGGSFRDKRHFAATAVLVQHPKGDLLIDAGFGSHVAEHVAMLPRLVRAPYRVLQTVSEQLDGSGYDRNRLLGVLVTHSHWDHVSGLDDLRVPVWINRAELGYAAEDPDGKVFRSMSCRLEIHEYPLDGPAYLGFSGELRRAWRRFGHHRPRGGPHAGSVVVFVTLPTARGTPSSAT